MTDKKTRESQLLELIQDAVNLSTVHAKEYGETFNSMHEAWAFMEEEVEEAQEKTEWAGHFSELAWTEVKNDNKERFFSLVESMKECSLQGITELLQVVAVCNKIEGMRED